MSFSTQRFQRGFICSRELAWPAARLLAVAAVMLIGLKSSMESQAAEFRVPAGQRQLFLDDHGIAAMENLARKWHRPDKRGAVIRSPNSAQTLQTRTAPVWDPAAELYKLWVLGIDDNLWQSKDGLHWTPGPKTNMRIDMAVYDPCDPDPARRFKAPLLNEGFAVSADGANWTKLDVAKIASSDEGNFSYDPAEGLFIHTVKRGGQRGRAVALATSRDFTTWNDLGIFFQADDVDQQLGRQAIAARRADPTLMQTLYDDPNVYKVDVYNMGVFHYEGLYIGLPAMFHATGPVPNYPNTDGFHYIALCCSRDLKQWARLGDRRPFIGPSRLDSGAYDLTQLLPPSAPVIRDDELWFYYTGLKWRSSFHYFGTFPNGRSEKIAGRDRDGGAVCLAVLRRDGFVSLDAGATAGSLLTRPFLVPTGKLKVNVDAAGGELRVEALDQQGKVVASSEIVRGDLPQAEIVWQQGGLAEVGAAPLQLRFNLANASLYSYWFAE